MATVIPEERYQLTCCSTGNALTINGRPAVFVFTGDYKNNNHPDDFLEVVLTAIKDINGNIIRGCYRLTEADCFGEWEELLWQDVFIETECVNSCKECLPKPVILPAITDHKMIYAEYKVNNVDPAEAEQIYCAFGDANYEKVLALRYGIQHCCPSDLMQVQIEHEILKMDIAEDLTACATGTPPAGTCKKYIITIPKMKEGTLYFKDCNNIIRTVIVYAATNEYQTSVCGITGQTSTDIYMLASNPSLVITLPFVEDVDCN